MTLAPVATNPAGSATLSATTADYGACAWTSSGATTKVLDTNQDLDVTGAQASFGAPITGGATAGSTSMYVSCTDTYVPSLGAFTTNMANPLPTPTDSNPSASRGTSRVLQPGIRISGCYRGPGARRLRAATRSSGTTLTIPSPWVNGGKCSYGSLGSNSAGGNTDSFATCPPTQYDVNIGYVDCSDTASSGTSATSFNYSTDDVLFNGQPVPQQSTATLSTPTASSGATVSITGGTNWWGSAGGAPNTGPYGDFQSGAMYQASAPGVYIGTTRSSALPVLSSTVTIGANSYACTGAESTTVGPNPCTMTPGQPSGSFKVPSGLAPGSYNIYIDESNTTPLPGNGPNDSYQTAQGTNLGTAESVSPLSIVGSTSTTVSLPATSSVALGDLTQTPPPSQAGRPLIPPDLSLSTSAARHLAPRPVLQDRGAKFDTESLSGTTNPSQVTSAEFTPGSTGYFCFAAVYSGDSNYSGSSDTTVDECFDVTASGSTTVSLPATSSVALGGSDTDSATVTGGSSPDPAGICRLLRVRPDT